MIIYGGYHHINKIGEFLQFSSKRKGIRAWNFRMMIRKIWQFLWYQNRNNFEKKWKKKGASSFKIMTNYKQTDFEISLNMKDIREFTQQKIWISQCNIHAREHAPKAPCAVWAQSCSALDIFNALHVFAHEPIREQEIKWESMNNISHMVLWLVTAAEWLLPPTWQTWEVFVYSWEIGFWHLL